MLRLMFKELIIIMSELIIKVQNSRQLSNLEGIKVVRRIFEYEIKELRY